MKKISYLDMVKTLLPEQEFDAFAQSYTKPLKKSIKILKSNQHLSTIHEQLTNDGRNLTPPNFSRKGKTYDDVLFVDKTDKQSLWSHPLHQQGAFYVQEMAAGPPAQILMNNYFSPCQGRGSEAVGTGLVPVRGKAEEGLIVLDLCAAPGGKSIQLADHLLTPWQAWPRPGGWGTNEVNREAGLLIANELNPNRRKALKANLERCGIRNAIITGYDGKELGDLLYEQCDKVLLDAPCSGEGMQYKSDFKIYQRNEKQAKKLAHTQYELLISGCKALKIWGELVYSTCTTNTIENEGVVMKILETLGDSIELVNVEIEEKSPGIPWSSPGFPLLRGNVPTKSGQGGWWENYVARFRPHIHHTGGFFIAKFKKIKSTKNGFPLLGGMSRPLSGLGGYKQQYTTCPRSTAGESEARGLPPDIVLLQTKHTIRAVAKKAVQFLDLLYIDQAGLPIFKILNNGEWKALEGLDKLPNPKNSK